MKAALLILAALCSASVLAEMPKVACFGMAHAVNEDGTTGEGPISHGRVDAVGEKSKPVTFGKATVDSTLQEICASDGGPCTGTYTLYTTLKIGDSSASTSSYVSSRDLHFRQHLSARAGLETAFVNCDLIR